MAEIPDASGTPVRSFVCQTLNPWGFPAKDRSGGSTWSRRRISAG
jgi:hypothetical protein